jgi:hypothetical protein
VACPMFLSKVRMRLTNNKAGLIACKNIFDKFLILKYKYYIEKEPPVI